jgi:hypothetical protein
VFIPVRAFIFVLRAVAIFLRAGLPFFLFVVVRRGVTLSIFAWADNELGSIGSSFLPWTVLVFLGTDRITVGGTIGK